MLRAAVVLVSSVALAGATPEVVARIPVPAAGAPCAAAKGGDSVWVSLYASPWLVRIDPATNTVAARTKIGSGSCGLGYGAGFLWVEDTSSNTVSRVSATTGRRTAAIKVGASPYDATFAFGAAWATGNVNGELDRIDPRTNKVVRRTKNCLGASGVVAAFGSLWVACYDGAVRVSPRTGKIVARVKFAGPGAWTAASDDAVWISTGAGALVRIDPRTNRVVATVKVADTPVGDPAVVAGMVWAPVIAANQVAVVDPATNAVSERVAVGKGPFVVTEIDGEAWVPSWKGADVWRLRPQP